MGTILLLSAVIAILLCLFFWQRLHYSDISECTRYVIELEDYREKVRKKRPRDKKLLLEKRKKALNAIWRYGETAPLILVILILVSLATMYTTAGICRRDQVADWQNIKAEERLIYLSTDLPNGKMIDVNHAGDIIEAKEITFAYINQENRVEYKTVSVQDTHIVETQEIQPYYVEYGVKAKLWINRFLWWPGLSGSEMYFYVPKGKL